MAGDGKVYSYGSYPVLEWVKLHGTDIEIRIHIFQGSDFVTIEQRSAA